MTETNSGEVPTASLVGALAIFPLNDVLGLLAETGQRGELQVVGQGVDGHLWIDGKDLVGASLEGANTLTQAVFELILLDEGWFYFTSDQIPPAGQVQHQSVSSVINEVVPQVQEWRDLLKPRASRFRGPHGTDHAGTRGSDQGRPVARPHCGRDRR